MDKHNPPSHPYAAEGSVLVYGSLAQRNAKSKEAIAAAAAAASRRVFDINLRPPFIDPAGLCRLNTSG